MTISTTMLQSDLDFMINDLPTTVTWGGTDYSCVVGDITSGDDLEIAGVMDTNALSIVISKDDFSGSYPDEGDRVTIASVNYRVQSIIDGPDGIARTLVCVGDTE